MSRAKSDDTAPAGYIRPELADAAVPIGSVSRYPGNARRGNHTKIKNGLREHGQYKTILVQDSTGYIVVGNNTHECMQQLGWTHVAVTRLKIDDERARQLVLYDNASSDDAQYDKQALVDLLAGVQVWDGTGYVPEDLDALLEQLTADVDALDELADSPTLDDAVPDPDDDEAAGGRRRREGSTPADAAADVDAAPHTDADPSRGLVQMAVRLSPDDRTQATGLVDAAREWLGADLTAGDIVLRALRVLACVGDSRHTPEQAFTLGQLLTAAGHTEQETT